MLIEIEAEAIITKSSAAKPSRSRTKKSARKKARR
jgi:hypothetical protein